MSSPVDEGVKQVAQKETGEKAPGIKAQSWNRKQGVEKQEQEGGHEQPGHGWHEKPLLVSRIQVMGAVHDEMKALHQYVLRDPMEQVPVKQVFRKGPNEKRKHEEERKFKHRDAFHGCPVIDQESDNRTIDDHVLSE